MRKSRSEQIVEATRGPQIHDEGAYDFYPASSASIYKEFVTKDGGHSPCESRLHLAQQYEWDKDWP